MIVATKNYERNAKNSFRSAIIPHGCTKYKIALQRQIIFQLGGIYPAHRNLVAGRIHDQQIASVEPAGQLADLVDVHDEIPVATKKIRRVQRLFQFIETIANLIFFSADRTDKNLPVLGLKILHLLNINDFQPIAGLRQDFFQEGPACRRQ